MVDALVAAGMDCARLNCSHGTADDLRLRTGDVRAAAERAGRSVGLLFDLQGPKLRLSAETPTRMLQPGEQVVFVGLEAAGGNDRVRVDFLDFPRLVTERSEIVIGDGVPRLVVDSLGPGEVVARAVSVGQLAPRKGVNVTFARPELPAITDKDVADLALAAELGADFIALSFVRSAADIEELQARLAAHDWHGRAIAKIEKVEAYENLPSCRYHGCLWWEDVAELVVRRCAALLESPYDQPGKVVITATPMLESMIHSPHTTLAEAQTSPAVIEVTSAVMLSPIPARRVPVAAVRRFAVGRHRREFPDSHGARSVHEDTPAAAVMHAASSCCRRRRGGADRPDDARQLASRVRELSRLMTIIALDHDQAIADQLALESGVYPRTMPVGASVDDLVESALVTAKEFAGLPTGARVAITAGCQTGASGGTI